MRGAAARENGGEGAAKGPSPGTRSTSSPPTTAHPAARPKTTRHAAGETAQRTRCGLADPSVSAPTRMPIASPLPSLNHPAAIFILGGYTAASAAPVRSRQPIPTVKLDAVATPTVAAAAIIADPA